MEMKKEKKDILIKDLIVNKNFLNSQHYIMWENEKIKNIFSFLSSSGYSFIIIPKVYIFLYSLFKKINIFNNYRVLKYKICDKNNNGYNDYKKQKSNLFWINNNFIIIIKNKRFKNIFNLGKTKNLRVVESFFWDNNYYIINDNK